MKEQLTMTVAVSFVRRLGLGNRSPMMLIRYHSKPQGSLQPHDADCRAEAASPKHLRSLNVSSAIHNFDCVNRVRVRSLYKFYSAHFHQSSEPSAEGPVCQT